MKLSFLVLKEIGLRGFFWYLFYIMKEKNAWKVWKKNICSSYLS